MSKGVQENSEERPIAEVTVGSVTVPIYYAPVTIKVVSPPKEANGQPSEEFKKYESYAIVYYEARSECSGGVAPWTRRRPTRRRLRPD